MKRPAISGWAAAVLLGAAAGSLPASIAVGQESAAPAASLSVIGLKSGAVMTGAVQRIDNAGIVIGTPHGSITIPWEQMDDATLSRFSQYAPVARPPASLAPEFPDDTGRASAGRDRSRHAPADGGAVQTLLGLLPAHLAIWAAVCAALLAACAAVVPNLARRRRRSTMLWLTLALAIPLSYWALLWLVPEPWLIVLRPFALVVPWIVPLILTLLRKRKPSAEELARRMAALEPPPPRTIALKKPKTDTEPTVLDRRTWEKERSTFDRRFFERFLIPWFREIQGAEALRPIVTIRARGRGLRVRRIVQADEVGVLIALEESGDPPANAERYPYCEIEEVTIARPPTPPVEIPDDDGEAP